MRNESLFKRAHHLHGFILIIILGLLGVLAFVSVMFLSQTRQAKILASNQMGRAQAGLFALSGFEKMKAKSLNQFGSFVTQDLINDYKEENDIDGDGFSDMTFRCEDLNGKININDGIRAGYLELGNSYVANALDPWPSFSVDVSALINLRIRRLLNAYGDVHRFSDFIYEDKITENVIKNHYGDALPPNGLTSFSTDEKRGQSMPKGEGLGDAILSQRPVGGFRRLEEIEDIVNQWSLRSWGGTPHISQAYLDRKSFDSFYAFVTPDLTVSSYEDKKLFRLKDETSLNLGDYAQSEALGPGKFFPVGLQKNPPNFSDMWRPHSVALINVNTARKYVLAAVFYAPCNVSYLYESASTVPPYIRRNSNLSNFTMGKSSSQSMLSSPNIGIGGPIFKEPFMENGVVGNGTPGLEGGSPYHLMSLRDAMLLADRYFQKRREKYNLENDSPYLHFEGFRSFLKQQKNSLFGGISFERVLKDPTPPDTIPGVVAWDKAFFYSNYIFETLPEILCCVRRLPGYLGAPEPLTSPPFLTVKPHPTAYLSGGDCQEGMIKSEDFVWRFMHPKICFLPQGYYQVRARGFFVSPVGKILAKHTLNVMLSLFETQYYRTQKDFVDITNISYSQTKKILIGPSFRSGPDYPNKYMGFVGMKDFDDDLIQDPLLTQGLDSSAQIVMNFDPDDGSGLKNSSVFASAISPEDCMNDEWAKNLGPVYYEPFRNSYMEGSDKAILGDFSDADAVSDLNPFGGANFLSLGHGEFSAIKFGYSLYFRLYASIETDEPAAKNLTAGCMVFWFRLPTEYPYTHDVYRTDIASPMLTIASKNFSHALITLNMWEKYETKYDLGTGIVVVTRPVTLTVGLKTRVAGDARPYMLFARYDSGGCPDFDDGGNTLVEYKGDNNALFPLTTAAVYNSGASDQYDFMGLHLYAPTTPNSYNFLASYETGAQDAYLYYRRNSHISAETQVRISNKSFPGSWHRAGVYWNLRFGPSAISLSAMETQAQLYATLFDVYNMDETGNMGEKVNQHVAFDPSIVDSYPAVNFSYPIETVIYKGTRGIMATYDSLMTLSLGESHARRMFSSSFYTSTNPKQYVPYWRLNSSIDNLRIFMGSSDPLASPPYRINSIYLDKNSGGLYKMTPPNNNAEKIFASYRGRRYLLSNFYSPLGENTARWTIHFPVPKKSQLLFFRTRGYRSHQNSSSSNTPFGVLAFTPYDNSQEITPNVVIENNNVLVSRKRSTHSELFNALKIDQFNVEALYGNDVVNEPYGYIDSGSNYGSVNISGDGDLTEIEWLKEMSIGYVPAKGPTILSWWEGSD
jgi:hypothetical protein